MADNAIYWVIGLIILVIFIGPQIGLYTVFPEKVVSDIWRLEVKDQLGTNVYNEGDSLKTSVSLTPERIKDLNALAQEKSITFDSLLSGSGICYWYSREYPRLSLMCGTPDVIYNNPNYQNKMGVPISTWEEGCRKDKCDISYCPDCWFDGNYKTNKHDCGPHIFVDDKLMGYDLNALGNPAGTILSPGFHEVEYLGYYRPAYGSESSHYCSYQELYLRTEIYVIPDPCKLTEDQTLVLEGPFKEPFSKADFAHQIDNFCSRFPPLIFNSKLGLTYDDIALEKYYTLKNGGTITPTEFEEYYIFYITSDIGVVCETDEAYYDGKCTLPNSLLNVVRCEEGTLEVMEDGSVVCVQQGQVVIVCPEGSSFDQDLQQCVEWGDVQIICPEGSVLDEDIGLCVIEGETEITCPIEALWNEELQKCVIEGEIEGQCDEGTWSEEQQICITEGEVSYTCSSGYYDYNLDRCVVDTPSKPSPAIKPDTQEEAEALVPTDGFNWIIVLVIVGLGIGVYFYFKDK